MYNVPYKILQFQFSPSLFNFKDVISKFFEGTPEEETPPLITVEKSNMESPCMQANSITVRITEPGILVMMSKKLDHLVKDQVASHYRCWFLTNHQKLVLNIDVKLFRLQLMDRSFLTLALLKKQVNEWNIMFTRGNSPNSSTFTFLFFLYTDFPLWNCTLPSVWATWVFVVISLTSSWHCPQTSEGLVFCDELNL